MSFLLLIVLYCAYLLKVFVYLLIAVDSANVWVSVKPLPLLQYTVLVSLPVLCADSPQEFASRLLKVALFNVSLILSSGKHYLAKV